MQTASPVSSGAGIRVDSGLAYIAPMATASLKVVATLGRTTTIIAFEGSIGPRPASFVIKVLAARAVAVRSAGSC